jgi:hypothetical protein
MKFNSRTRLEQMPACKQGFYLFDSGEVATLFHKNGDWFVASFDKDGFCTNASSYPTRKEAWRLFLSIVEDDLTRPDHAPAHPEEEMPAVPAVAEVHSSI